MTQEIPEGFVPFPYKEGFLAVSGPYYFKETEDGKATFGLLTGPQHANPNGVLHGGVLMAFADTVMGTAVYMKRGRCATVSLNTEFVGNVEPGAWVEAEVEITRLTGSLAFVRGTLTSGEETLLTASGVWKLFKKPREGHPDKGPDV